MSKIQLATGLEPQTLESFLHKTGCVLDFLCILCTHYYEKSRNEKMRNTEKPFKFGTIVDEEYVTTHSLDYERLWM